MGVRKVGQATYQVEGVSLLGTGTVGGPMEAKGPLAPYFDSLWESETPDQQSFEGAELALLMESQMLALKRSGVDWSGIDLVFSGDLLDQLTTSNFAGRSHARPLLGVFSACASFTEGMGLAALTIAGGGPERALVSAGSHHYAAERQFRFPVELGVQRPPTAAWTSTAAGSAVLAAGDEGPLKVEAVSFGHVVDFGYKNPNDMGSAMVPAAVSTIHRLLEDTHTRPEDYDQILTGDLGAVGHALAVEFADREYGLQLGPVLNDCGLLIYDRDVQDVHNGASGAGCSASVFGSLVTHRLLEGEWRRVLLAATGALFSPTSFEQGESIPGIAHAVVVSRTS